MKITIRKKLEKRNKNRPFLTQRGEKNLKFKESLNDFQTLNSLTLKILESSIHPLLAWGGGGGGFLSWFNTFKENKT